MAPQCARLRARRRRTYRRHVRLLTRAPCCPSWSSRRSGCSRLHRPHWLIVASEFVLLAIEPPGPSFIEHDAGRSLYAPKIVYFGQRRKTRPTAGVGLWQTGQVPAYKLARRHLFV